MQAGFADGFAAAGAAKNQQRGQKKKSHTPQINADERGFKSTQIQCGSGCLAFGGCDGERLFDFIAELPAELILRKAGTQELLGGLAHLLQF